MRIKDALAIAAARGGISTKDGNTIVATFLSELARCPTCDGEGTFTFLRDVRIPVAEIPGLDEVNITEGTSGTCPQCAGTKRDLRYVHWVCFSENSRDTCEQAKGTQGDTDHKQCGLWPIMPALTRDPRSDELSLRGAN